MKVCYSDVSAIQMFAIQIPTALQPANTCAKHLKIVIIQTRDSRKAHVENEEKNVLVSDWE